MTLFHIALLLCAPSMAQNLPNVVQDKDTQIDLDYLDNRIRKDEIKINNITLPGAVVTSTSIGGNGISNQLMKWVGIKTAGNSLITDNGSSIVANANMSTKLLDEGGQVFNVLSSSFGAKGDGTGDDAPAIQSALWAASLVSNGGSDKGVSSIVYLPHGTYNIKSQLKIPNDTVLRGAGRRSSYIIADNSFPTATALIRLGTGGASPIFGTRVENLMIDANSISGSTGVFSSQANEGCGVFDSVILNYRGAGIELTSQGATTLIDRVEIFGGVGGSTVSIHYNVSSGILNISNTIVDPLGTYGVLNDLGTVNITTLHCEDAVNCVAFGSGGSVNGVTGLASVTNVINILPSNPNVSARVTAFNVYSQNSPIAILDNISTMTFTQTGIAQYNSQGTYFGRGVAIATTTIPPNNSLILAGGYGVGQIGIGKDNPNRPVDIVGDIDIGLQFVRVSSNTRALILLQSSSSTVNGEQAIFGVDYNGGAVGYSNGNNGGVYVTAIAGPGGIPKDLILQENDAKNIIFVTNNLQRGYIYSDGTWNIGSGATVSTFSPVGALTLAAGAALTASGNTGYIVGGSSISGNFFGNCAGCTGITELDLATMTAFTDKANIFTYTQVFNSSVSGSFFGNGSGINNIPDGSVNLTTGAIRSGLFGDNRVQISTNAFFSGYVVQPANLVSTVAYTSIPNTFGSSQTFNASVGVIGKLGIGTLAPGEGLTILKDSANLGLQMKTNSNFEEMYWYSASGVLNADILSGDLNNTYGSGGGGLSFFTGANFSQPTMVISTTTHIEYSGSAPSISACGAAPVGSVVGNDSTGIITVGGGVVTACTMTFKYTWVNTPICNVTDTNASIGTAITSASNSAITIGMSSTLGGGTLYYSCRGYR